MPGYRAELAAPTLAQDKKVLGHEEYEIWRGVGNQAILRDGRWVLYSLTLQDGDPELVIRSVGEGTEYRVPRGASATFTASGAHVVALVRPAKDVTRQAKLDKKKPEGRPKSALVIVNLSDGGQTVVERVKSFKIPEDRGGWVAYLMEKAMPDSEQAGDEPSPENEQPEAEAAAEEESAETSGQEGDEAGDDKKEPKKDGTTLILHDLADGTEQRYDFVTEYAAATGGDARACLTSTSGDTDDGAFLVSLGAGLSIEPTALASGAEHYSDLAVSESGGRVAVLTDSATYANDDPEFVLYLRDAQGAATTIARAGSEGIESGWWASDNATPTFSPSGARLYFGTALRSGPCGGVARPGGASQVSAVITETAGAPAPQS